MSAALGLYLHVPFCRTRCRYCDFYRVGENAERQVSFLDGLRREIDGWTALHGRAVDTVFFGGGTPSLLSPAQVGAVLDQLAGRFQVAGDAEITAECNPSDLSPEKLAAYRAAGLNRLSFGVQSLNERELRLLGRRHDAERARSCVAWAREAGFENLSLDLMLAIPGQTDASFGRTLEGVVELEPDHLSLYLLEVHEKSEMDFLRRERPRLFPGEEAQRRRYLRAAERLTRAGYDHYEISNFARPGRASRHNLKYWQCEDFLGLGPAAHSCIDGRRFRHAPDLEGYLAEPNSVEAMPCDLESERIFLGLRLSDGVPEHEAALASRLEAAAWDRKLRELEPFLERGDGRLRLNREGRLVSTAVLAELLAAAPAVAV